LKLRRLFLCLILLLLAGSALSADGPKYLGITFLTTNDLHLHEMPFTWPADARTGAPAIPDVGGMARISTIVSRTRAESCTPVMLFDSGDTTHGYGALARTYHGGSIIALMNAMRYDAMAPGNHEFQWHGIEPVRNIKESKFPWVCANVIYADSGKPFLPAYIIKDAWGARVAVFGLTNDLPSTQPKTYVAGPELGLKVLPPKEVAAKMVAELRGKADIVVLLSHLGSWLDMPIAKEIPGIDLILGGHSHSFFNTPRMAQVGVPSAFSIGAVPIVQAGYYGRKMGLTRLIFRRDDSGRYRLMSCKGELLDVNASIPDDPEIVRIIQDFTTRIPPPPPK